MTSPVNCSGAIQNRHMKNNKNILGKTARLFNPKDKIPMSPVVILTGVMLLFLSILGLRDVIFTPMLVSITGNGSIRLWIPVIYWAGVVLSAGMILVYAINNPPVIAREDLLDAGIYLVLSLPFFYLLITERLFLDFWLDELMSIVRHIRPSISEAVLSYPAPNNHIFSNLVSAIYVQVIGSEDLYQILANPYLLRLPYLLSAIITVLVTGFTAKKFINKVSGYNAVILLGTTIPYLNFVVQVRGYSFSILFFSLLILSALSYRKSPTKWKAAGIVGLTCLLIYTIPSNIYAISAIYAYYFAMICFRFFSTRRSQNKKQSKERINEDGVIFLLLTGGIALSALLYLPLIPKMMGDSYMKSSGLFSGNIFQGTFQQIFLHLISRRWAIIIPAGVGIILYSAKFSNVANRETNQLAGITIFSMVIPFVASYSRGDQPFERVFLVLLPAFILILSLGISEIIDLFRDRLPKLPLSSAGFVIVIFLVSNLVFYQTFNNLKGQIKQNLEDQKFDYVQVSDNRMWASHFLDYYQVLPLVDILGRENAPRNIYLDNDNLRYEWVVATYLDAFGINFRNYSDIDDFANQDYIVVTSYSNSSVTKIRSSYPNSDCVLLSPALSIYQAWGCHSNSD